MYAKVLIVKRSWLTHTRPAERLDLHNIISNTRLYMAFNLFSAMDPVTAFGLAGAILQFVNSGSKFISLIWRVYRTGNDSSDDISELHLITNDLQQTLQHLSPSEEALTDRDAVTVGILRLAEDCQKIATELLSSLTKLQLPDVPRKRDALKRAFQVRWNEGEVRSLQGRLDAFRNQLVLHLLVSLRYVILFSCSSCLRSIGC